MPIPDRFWEIAPEADRFLVCYPRSGSRWLRLLLSDIAFCLSDLDPGQLYERRYIVETGGAPTHHNMSAMDGFCPDIYTLIQEAGVERNPAIKPSLVSVFRSHSLASLDQCPGCRVIYLFRNPTSVLLSYIHFARCTGHLGDDLADLEPFCIARVEEWVKHVEDAILYMETAGERVCMVRYLDEVPFSVSQVGKIVAILGIPASKILISQALVRFEKLLGRLNRSGCFAYARGSNQGQLQSVAGMTPELIKAVQGRIKTTFERANRLAVAAD